MAVNSPLPREPVPPEEPSPNAAIGIRLGYAGPQDRPKWRVPPDQADYMIMTGGVLGSVFTGTAGAVLTLCAAPERTGLARAVLIVAAAAAGVIAAGRWSRATAGPKAARRQPKSAAGAW